jgi:integrase
MATLEFNQRSLPGTWYVRFYYHGKRWKHSCGKGSERRARQVLAAVEATLEKLQNGHLIMPDGIDPKQWIISGGREFPSLDAGHATPTKNQNREVTFGDTCDRYLSEQVSDGAKASTTLAAERTHIGHLKRLIGQSKSLSSIDLEVLKRYRSRRDKERYRGKIIKEALRRELTTFRQIWVWAQDAALVSSTCPLLRANGRWRIRLPKPTENLKFQTWQQIERRISRGGLAEDEIKELWNSLYLDWTQVEALLNHVHQNAEYSFIYPMFAFVAYTGARRSEVLRSQIDDIDFESDQVTIRERKRRKDRSASQRVVSLHPELRTILTEWFRPEHHPGGQFTIATPAEMPRRKPALGPQPLTWSQGTHHFKQPLKNRKWQVVRGFHVLRHSFGSNLVRTGKVSAEVVAEWMGHTSDEMRALYQHLFPQDGVNLISLLGEEANEGE